MTSRHRISGTGRLRCLVPLLWRLALALAIGTGGGTLGGCASTAPEGEPERIQEAFVPAFEALEAAVWARDEPLARRILAGLRLRPLGEAELHLADSFERILDGRAILAGIRLRLEVEPLEDEPTRRLLTLVAYNSHPAPIALDLPPATLRRKTTVLGLMLTEEGLEPHDAQQLETDHVNALEGFRLAAGEESRLELLEFDLSAEGLLAIRDRWSLELRSGEVEMDGELYPAQHPKVTGTVAVALADWLPTDPLEPAELVRYAGQPQVTTGGLLERAVRIPPERRSAAVQALRDAEPDLDDARMAELVPALRWLTGSLLPGADPRAWRRWLRYRGDEEEADANFLSRPGRGLELPNR